MSNPYVDDTTGVTPTEVAAEFPPIPAHYPQDVNNPVDNAPTLTDPPTTPEPANIPAPVFDAEPDLTPDAKLDRVYRFVARFESLLDSIGPEQVQQVSRIANNPMFARMFGKR